MFVPHIDVELNARGVIRPQTGLNDAVHHVGGAGVWQADAPIGNAVAGRKVLGLRGRDREGKQSVKEGETISFYTHVLQMCVPQTASMQQMQSLL